MATPNSSRRESCPRDRPDFFAAGSQIPQASRRALELWPESGAYPVGTQKLLVSHEFSAKRKDEVKRLLPLRGEASECELWTLNQCTIGQSVTK